MQTDQAQDSAISRSPGGASYAECQNLAQCNNGSSSAVIATQYVPVFSTVFLKPNGIVLRTLLHALCDFCGPSPAPRHHLIRVRVRCTLKLSAEHVHKLMLDQSVRHLREVLHRE